MKFGFGPNRISATLPAYALLSSPRPMTIWDICIRRPIFTAMLISAPLVLGLASFARLGVDLFPNVDLPIVSVTTTLRGASVEEMETGVTKPIEEIVNTVSGILVSDFWGAYNAVECALRQTCLVHLLRDLEHVEKYKNSGGDWPA
ncbi:MAG TPA: efflux RND transporter permease subunit, partial [Planctomycetaceae bacterium]|nr:efflux RND transporter permease subunit [Planctomycetaceae bacterium]